MPALIRMRIELEHISPPIWRRIVVPSSLALFELHVVLQGAMGWEDTHLHGFEISGRRYEVPEDDEFGPETGYLDERLHRLEMVISDEEAFSYVYDFGDNWRHLVTVEAHEDVPTSELETRCIAGERACPPEDCGGAYDYQDFLGVLANPKHPDHADIAVWANGFEPEVFSVSRANSLIQALRELHREQGTGFGRFS